MGKYFGIDLGETEIAIAKIDDNGMPVLVKNMYGDDKTAAAIFLTSDRKYSIGKSVTEDASGGVAVRGIRKKIGDISHQVNVFGIQYNPVELTAVMLKSLKDEMEKRGEKADGVIVTVPAYFGQVERKNTTDAAKIAGLNVLSLINEPTAAINAYANETNLVGKKTAIAFSLSETSHELALFEITKKSVSEPPQTAIITTQSNPNSGWNIFNKVILDIIRKKISMQLRCDPADSFKVPGSTRENIIKTDTIITNLATRGAIRFALMARGQKVVIDITKDEFVMTSRPLIDQIMQTIESMMMRQKLRAGGINQILLVGDKEKLQLLNDAIKRNMNYTRVLGVVEFVFAPESAFAKGAVLWAYMMAGEKIVRKTTLSYQKEQVTPRPQPQAVTPVYAPKEDMGATATNQVVREVHEQMKQVYQALGQNNATNYNQNVQQEQNRAPINQPQYPGNQFGGQVNRQAVANPYESPRPSQPETPAAVVDDYNYQIPMKHASPKPVSFANAKMATSVKRSYGIVIPETPISKHIYNLLTRGTLYKGKKGYATHTEFQTTPGQKYFDLCLMESDVVDKYVALHYGKEYLKIRVKLPDGIPAKTTVSVDLFIDPRDVMHIKISERYRGTVITMSQPY